MIKTGKCPGCGKVPNFGIDVQPVDIKAPGGAKWRGIMYVCPDTQCHTILGVGIDPLALKTDVVDGVIKALREKR